MVVNNVPARMIETKASKPPVSTTTRKVGKTSWAPVTAPMAANSLTSPAPMAPKTCSMNIKTNPSAQPARLAPTPCSPPEIALIARPLTKVARTNGFGIRR